MRARPAFPTGRISARSRSPTARRRAATWMTRFGPASVVGAVPGRIPASRKEAALPVVTRTARAPALGGTKHARVHEVDPLSRSPQASHRPPRRAPRLARLLRREPESAPGVASNPLAVHGRWSATEAGRSSTSRSSASRQRAGPGLRRGRRAGGEDSPDGSFEFEGLPDGRYVIEGLAPGYASSFSRAFAVTGRQTTSTILVRMTHGGSLTGQIVDVENKPVAEPRSPPSPANPWTATCSSSSPRRALGPHAGQARTDADDASGSKMTPGDYGVEVRAKGFAPDFCKHREDRRGPRASRSRRARSSLARRSRASCGATA